MKAKERGEGEVRVIAEAQKAAVHGYT